MKVFPKVSNNNLNLVFLFDVKRDLQFISFHKTTETEFKQIFRLASPEIPEHFSVTFSLEPKESQGIRKSENLKNHPKSPPTISKHLETSRTSKNPKDSIAYLNRPQQKKLHTKWLIEVLSRSFQME